MIFEGDGEFVGFGGGNAGECVEVRTDVSVRCVQEEIAFGPDVFGAEVGSEFLFDVRDGARVDGDDFLADGGGWVIGGEVGKVEVVALVMDGEGIVAGELDGLWIIEDACVFVVVGGEVSAEGGDEGIVGDVGLAETSEDGAFGVGAAVGREIVGLEGESFGSEFCQVEEIVLIDVRRGGGFAGS